MNPKVFRVTFSVRSSLHVGARDDVPLWVVGRTPEHAITRARQHARRNFDDKRPVLTGVVLVGTIDVP